MYEVRPHRNLPGHWSVDGTLVAGADTASDAVALFEAVRHPPLEERLSQPTADDVRAEAQRRMILLLGARDAGHLQVLISNGSRAAIRLLRKGAENWTPQERTRATELEVLDMAIEALRAASNALETNPPADYNDDQYWPPRME